MNIFMLFLMLATINLAGADAILMKEGVTYPNHIYEMNGKIFYKFEVGESIPQNEDLVVIATPTHIGADPDIFISTTNPEPQNPQTSDVSCSSFGYDLCVLPSEKITPNSTIYVAIYCQYWCDFEVTVQYSKVVEVTAPDEVPIYLDQNGFKQIKVKVPQSKDADHLFFEANYKNFKNASSMLSMYLNRGDLDPSTFSFSISSVPAWNEGAVIPISKDNGQFCLDCLYSILIHGESNTMLQFKAQISHESYDINLNTRYDETLGYNGTLFYTLNLSNETLGLLSNQTLNFELLPYLGNPDLYLNPGTKPASLSDYKLISNSSVGETLTLTPLERDLKESVYYIAVHSYRTATFSLLVYPSNKNGKKITFGMSENGYIEPMEIINFYLDIPKDQDDLKIEATLHNVFGNTELFIKRCFLESSVCEFMLDDIQAAKKGNISTIYSSWQKSADNRVSFVHNSSECQETKAKSCRYVAAVTASGNSTSHYELIMYYQEKHIILRNTIPVKGSLEIGEEAHYRFTLPDDQYVGAMVFQVTPISGIPQLYSSKTILYPTVTEFQKAACGCSHMIVYCGRSSIDIPLKSTYFLTVHAFSHTVYTLTAYVMAWGVKPILELHQSQPQKFAFRNNSEPAYFKFNIPSSELAKEKIRISLTPINGQFKMYLGQEFVPDTNIQASYFLSTETNTLIIEPERLQLIKDNNFYVTVMPQHAPADADEAASKIQFTILYAPYAGISRLQEGHPQNVKLIKSEPQYFQFNAQEQDELLRFTATVLSGDVSFYISGRESFPSSSINDYSASRSTLHSLEIDGSELRRICLSNGSQICVLFVGIYSENSEDAEITFSVTKNKTINSVQDGIPLDFLTPRPGRLIHFYAYPTDAPFYVGVSSGDLLNVFVSMMNISKTPAVVDWNFPNLSNSVGLERTLGGNYNIIVNPKGCKECILGITISSTEAATSQQKGTLIITTNSRKLRSGTSFVDSVKGNSFKYYNFELTNSSQSASIYLTPFGSCSPGLYLTKGRDHLPTKNNFTWSSNDTVAPSIRVVPQQSASSTEGYYNLGVFDTDECIYSLTFSSQNVKMLGLQPGIPQELDLVPGQSDIYLTYVDHKIQPIKIMLARDVGDTNLFIKSLVNSSNRSITLPSEQDHEYNTKSIYTKDFIHIPKRGSESAFYEYIINVQNNEKTSNSKLSLILSAEGYFTQLYPGKTYRDFVNRSSTNRYAYTQGSLKQEEIELTLTVYSGEPTLIASTDSQISNSNYRWKETSINAKSTAGPKVISMKLSRGSTHDFEIKENDPIYYLVISDNDSYYDITLKAANKNTVLQAGKFVEGTLGPLKQRVFSFLTPTELPLEGDKDFTLSIISLSEGRSPPSLKILYSEDTNQGSAEMIVPPDFEKVVGNVRNLNLPRKKGAYRFIALNTENLLVKYSLIFNYKNEVYLPLNTPVYDTVSKTKSQYYRIYIEKKGQLQLEIYHCYGQATFLLEKENRKDSTSSTRESIQLLTPSDHYSYASYEVEEGYYTATVTAREAVEIHRQGLNQTMEAGYKIAAMFLDSSVKAPHDFVLPGGSGNVKYDISKNSLDFEWMNIVMADDSLKVFNRSNVSDFEFAQRLVVSNSLLHLNMFAKCGMTSFAEFGVIEQPIFFMKDLMSNSSDPTLRTSIPFNSTSSIMYATVIAAVGPNFGGDYKDYHTPVPVFYKTITIQVVPATFDSKFIGKIVGVIFTLIVLLLICLKVIRSRTIKTEKKLHFEMTSGREIYDQVGELSHAEPNASISMQQSDSTYDEV